MLQVTIKHILSVSTCFKLTNMLSDDIPKVISFAKPVIPLVSQIKISLKIDGPMHSTMDVGSSKRKTVKKYPKRIKCKLNTSFAKGRAKGKQHTTCLSQNVS